MHSSDRIGRRMKLHDLHVLMAVAQAGSMGKAAQVLHTSQPAISRSIAALERAFGVLLLTRGAGGVEPTEYGHALLEGGAAVFDDLRQAVRRIEHLADPGSGVVRVGSTVFTAASFVCAVIDSLSRRYPRVAFDLVTASAEALHRELEDRRVDLLITRSHGRAHEDITRFERLFDDAFVVVAASHSPWARKRKVRLADLPDQAWVLPPEESVVHTVAAEAFRACGLAYPRAAVVTLTPEVRMSLVATGRFVTIVPDSVLEIPGQRPALKVLPIALPSAGVPSGIVTLKNRPLSPPARLFVETARAMARENIRSTRD